MELNVGKRLRELRERARVSQRELARKSGQSTGTVSAIELEKASPSVETLKRLLDALEVTFGEFFASGDEMPRTAFFTEQQMIEVRLGRIWYRHLSQSFEKDGLQLTLTTVQPGSDTSNVTHQSYDREIGLVLRGEIAVTIDGQTSIVGANCGYVVRGGQTIRIRNISDDICEYVFFSSPSALRTIISATSQQI